MEGFVNSPDAVKGLEFYKALYKCCTAPGMTNAYMQEGLDAFKSGQVAMQMNWFAFFPGLYKDPNVGGDKIGFFVNPASTKAVHAARRAGHLGGGLLRSQGRRARYIKWFAQPDVQKKWWAARRLFGCEGGGQRPELSEERAVCADFLKSMGIVKDFWAEPSYAAAPARHAEARA